MRRRIDGIEARIALSALLVALVAMGVLAIGVVVVGGRTFADLMAIGGIDVGSSESMFQDSVVRVVLAATVLAIALSIVLAMLIGRRLARPLRDAGDAAQRIAQGDYDSRLPRKGPDEIVTLADSFNQMAASLQEQRRIRDQFIADAAHELRTPLTNLQGYLEAMRDGVIAPEPAAFESLLEETERLVRLVALPGYARGGRRGPGDALGDHRPRSARRLGGGARGTPDALPGHPAGAATADAGAGPGRP